MAIHEIFKQRLNLHREKFQIMVDIEQFLSEDDRKTALSLMRSLSSIVKTEHKLNRQLSKDIKVFSKIDPDFRQVSGHIIGMDSSFRRQLRLIGYTRLHSVMRYKIKESFQKLKLECIEEAKLSGEFLGFISKRITQIKHGKKDLESLEKERDLFLKLNVGIRDMIKVASDVKAVNEKALELLGIAEALKKMRVYTYVKKDIDRVYHHLNQILEHPKKSKLAYLLTSFYIVSPGTYELTFIYLLLRYAGKYIVDDQNIVRKGIHKMVQGLKR
ncbi:hypothetical protein COV93_08955 [Candidatus Woesearchaeota archaeon CG11_big_fil_rev_8_21_14_0_20_43_8]|nr:MAG: hypothetical protein COV93_08955 [Candidatus Woesearchaeota archaeon CG11_big_fil_rev_8_21_14_0_20_43_8]